MTDHKAEALRNIEGLHDYQSLEGMSDESMLTVAIEAQTQATLYLAEQQRIANRVAYLAIARAAGGTDRATINLDYVIQAELGLA